MRTRGVGGELNRVRVGVSLLSIAALTALVAIAGFSGGVPNALIQEWSPPTVRPDVPSVTRLAAHLPFGSEEFPVGFKERWPPLVASPKTAVDTGDADESGKSAARTSSGFVWGPPRMPARAQLSLKSAEGMRGKFQHTQAQLPAQTPYIRVDVNQNNDEGDRIEPVNINIQLPSAFEPALAETKDATKPPATKASAKTTPQMDSLDSKAAVDQIDADGDAPPAAAVPSLKDSDAAATTKATSVPAATGGTPKLPAMWLVGSQGQPHPPHTSLGGSARSGNEHKARETWLSEVSDAELRSDHLLPESDGALAVSLPDLKTMSGRQLVALEKALQYEERDARDSATSMRGMDRAKMLSAQITRVRARLASMPTDIEKALAKNEEETAKKQREVQVLQGDLADEKRQVEAERKQEGPRSVRREERAMQAKVELQRAVASALADVKGAPAPKFAQLPAPLGTTDDDKPFDTLGVAAQEKEVRSTNQDLAAARAALAALHAQRSSLLQDIEAVHEAIGSDSATSAFGDGVGGEDWLAEEGARPKLKSARQQMLAEQPAGTAAAKKAEKVAAALDETGQEVQEAWDDAMDENNPSHLNEGDVRHGIVGGVVTVGNAITSGSAIDEHIKHIQDAHTFKTINPRVTPEHPDGSHEATTTEIKAAKLGGNGEVPKEVAPPHPTDWIGHPSNFKAGAVSTKHMGADADGKPKLQFCEWGSELVPCAPGYGGALYTGGGGDHPTDYGIWTPIEWSYKKPKIREHVYAGKRSQPYLSDMFEYGKAGIFGAHRAGGGAGSGIYKGSMLRNIGKSQEHQKSIARMRGDGGSGGAGGATYSVPLPLNDKAATVTAAPNSHRTGEASLAQQHASGRYSRRAAAARKMEHKSLGYGPELHEGARLIQTPLKVAFEKEAPTQMLSQRRRATKNKTAQDESGSERARAEGSARASLRVEEGETSPLSPPAHKPTSAPKPIAQATKAISAPKPIENTQLPALVKEEWDYHIDRKNEDSPEFADSILESGRQIHLAKHLDYGNNAAQQAGVVHGIVSPAEVDAMLDRDAIAHTGIPYEMPGKQTVKPGTGWVNEGARNSARVFGIVNPADEDAILSKSNLDAKRIPTEISGKDVKAEGWVSGAAKNSAVVFGIVNPNAVDSMISRAAIAKTGIPTQMSGSDRAAEGWVNEAAKNSAAVFGIINPNTVDKIISNGAISSSGIPTQVVGKGQQADGWVNEGARNAARVHGIVNPNTVDRLLSKDEIVNIYKENAKIKKFPIQTAGKGQVSAGWIGMDAKNAASVFGIVNPEDIQNVLEGGQLAARSPAPQHRSSHALYEDRKRALDARLMQDKNAELDVLNRLAHVSLN